MLKQMAATTEQVQVKGAIDKSVIVACQHGDRDALRVLFEQYKDRVYSTALYSLSGNEAAAADVTQQVFLKLISRINQFRGDADFATWLYRMVVNTCLDERRKQKRLVPLAEFGSMRNSRREPSQITRYTEHELSEHVQAAIAELSPKLRLPILLKYIEGFSYEEIAAVLDCSKGTVASRLNRGHKALARRLEWLRGKFVIGEH
jgi:RNA polymerase sigma-70 factor (ECF subfamily)